MQLTKRQEKQLPKVFENPKKLRKWLDEVDKDMERQYEELFNERINQYLNIYSVTVAYTAHYVLGLGKKRLPEFMDRVWNNLDCFKTGYLTLDDCVKELEDYGVDFNDILSYPGQIKRKEK